ncbi:MAG: hypothetical protein CR997_06980 [Acidobacteria bacterium]|nr:MAG: hypothetical protein CR997_06980 [Acidobacteriota bacterium]
MSPISQAENTVCIIPAGGMGSRMGLPLPKQLLPFNGEPLIAHVVRMFKNSVSEIVVATPRAHMDAFKNALGNSCTLVEGGSTRFESVYNGYQACSLKNGDLVIIHDAARPFLDISTLKEALSLTREKGAVVYGSQAIDTIKEVNSEGVVQRTLDRTRIYQAQTPQIFQAELLKHCYKTVFSSESAKKIELTDEASMAEKCGYSVHIYNSSPENRKITLREDLKLLQKSQQRIGHGYDVHRFDTGRPLVLCGINVPEGPGLLGHSDADVAIHALIDAILGACGMGDIGRHFPDTDPAYRGISSAVLLSRVLEKVHQKAFQLINIDLTIQAQIPKLSPYIEAMTSNLAKHLNLQQDCVNIKATTTEGLGFVGEKQGIAAHSVVLVEKGVLYE